MDYTELSVQERLQGYKSRVRQLEELHFEKELFAEEAEDQGLLSEAQELRDLCSQIEKRREYVLGKIAKLPKVESPDDGQDSTTAV